MTIIGNVHNVTQFTLVNLELSTTSTNMSAEQRKRVFQLHNNQTCKEVLMMFLARVTTTIPRKNKKEKITRILQVKIPELLRGTFSLIVSLCKIILSMIVPLLIS